MTAPVAADGLVETLAEPVRRRAEIEEFTNAAVIHPISFRLTLICARRGITPNAVSLTGMFCGLLAGICYHHDRQAGAVVAGFLLMVAWHVMDGTDGQLARLTRSQSELGKVLDGICDYVTFAAVYLGLASALAHRHGAVIWLIVAAAGACHAVQAATYEAQRQDYEIWGCGKRSPPSPKPMRAAARSRPSVWQQLSNRLDRVYQAVQSMGNAADPVARGRLAAAFGVSPERDADIRQRYCAAFGPAVRRWSVMSANYRTLAIFACCLAGWPLAYFLFEIVGLTAVSVVLLRFQHRRIARFVAGLDHAGHKVSAARDDRGTARSPAR